MRSSLFRIGLWVGWRRFAARLRIIGSALAASARCRTGARPARGVMAVWVLGGALLLGGCSALSFVYGRGPALGQWWLNRYVDFDASQLARARGGLTQWFDWHRREQLADDLALMERAARELQADITPAQACGWWRTFERKRERYLTQFTPALVDLASTLTPDQFGQIQRRFDQNNADWRDESLQVNPRERERAAIARVNERLESVYGKLDARQAEFVAERVRRTTWDPQRAYAERLARQRDTLQTLRTLAQPQPVASATAVAQAWMQRAFEPMDEAARQYRVQLLDDQCRFAADFHNRSTPAQRTQAAATLRGWAADLSTYVTAPLAPAASGPPNPPLNAASPAARP